MLPLGKYIYSGDQITDINLLEGFECRVLGIEYFRYFQPDHLSFDPPGMFFY